MKKVWFFGDSYCGYEENWVKQIATNLNAEVANLGVPGSSVYFLLNDLLEKRDKIQKEDTVILCITNTDRHFFNYTNLQPYMVHTLKREDALGYLRYDLNRNRGFLKLKNIELQAEEIYDAYRGYLSTLYSRMENWKQVCAITSHILDSIVPSLRTNNVLNLFSIYHNEYEEYKFFNPKHFHSQQSLWEFCSDYVKNTLKITDMVEMVKAVNDLPNHWIDTPEYYYKFWSTFNPAFEKIGAATPVVKPLL